MQATKRNTPPFLATTQTMTNEQRLWAWERRKRDHDDIEADDQRYLGAWIVMILIGLALTVGQFLIPCLWVWGGNGIQCL